MLTHSKFFILIISGTFLIVTIHSCTCNSKQKNKKNNKAEAIVEDSLQTTEQIMLEDSVLIFKNNMLLQQYHFSPQLWKNMKLISYWYEDSLKQTSFQPEKNFYTKYAPVLRWSPDSNYILDFGSYNSMVITDKNGKTHLENGEADTEVSFIEPKKKSKKQIFFFGPSAYIQNAQWISKEDVAIWGIMDDDGNTKPDTVVWIINAPQQIFRKYYWKE
jgi:hypothetical protein